MRPIYPIFFLSGVAGLIYQIVWVRQFGNAFGNTVHSASLVTATFMLGLGVGSYFFGAAADRKRWSASFLVRIYAWLEFAIALWGLGLAFVLPHVDAISAWSSSYSAGVNGWMFPSASSYALMNVLGALAIGPSTLLMGGTLTILIRGLIAGTSTSPAGGLHSSTA